jgi:hypothetical protein
MRTARLHRRGIGAPTPRGTERLRAQASEFSVAVDAAYAAVSNLLNGGLIDADEGEDLRGQIGPLEAEGYTIIDAAHADDAAIEAAIASLAQQQAKIEEITLLAANLLRSRVEGRTSSTFWWNVGAVALGLGAAFAWLAISKRKAV